MAKLYNLARMTTATTGTGPIMLGSAVSGFLSFASAGVANGDVVAYGIRDGANSEVGTGTYTSAGTTLTRTVTNSTNAGSPINLSGNAQVFITALKEQIGNLQENNTWSGTQTWTANNFSFGGAQVSNAGIIYRGTVTPDGEAAALQLSPGYAAVTAGSIYGIAIAPAAVAGSATFTSYVGIRSETFIKGAGNTVTNCFGILVDAQTAGSNLNRSIYVIGGVSEFDGQLIAKGTATNDNADVGDIGEFVSSEVLFGSAVPLATATAANITSISLTAGDWDVFGNVAIAPAGTTTTSSTLGWISTTSASLPAAPNKGAYTAIPVNTAAGSGLSIPTGAIRLSLASTTTVYLSTYVVFAVSTCSAFGYIGARRAR